MEDFHNNSASSDLNLNDEGAESDDSLSRRPLRQTSPNKGRGRRSSLSGFTKSNSYIRVSVGSRSKSEIRELKRKLIDELHQVKSLLKRVEAKEVEIYSCAAAAGYTDSPFSANHKARRLMGVNSEVGSADPTISRPPPAVTVSMADSNNGACCELVDKRNPKANNLNRNSVPRAGKQKIPSLESNKKMKRSNGGSDDNRRPGFGADKQSTQLFKSCSNLLTRLIKHKFGWVFNKPVDAEGLGLHDYFTIVKHPMDLGTVQTRLNKNWYKSPREFSEDVRLTFRNAMLYNPKGQDVHHMADTLLKMFEDKWKTIENDHNQEFRSYDRVVQTPSSSGKATNKMPAPPVLPSLVSPARGLDQLDSTTFPVVSIANPASLCHTSRTTVPKKPKEKDFPKREMTYEEKQKLSDDLQDLPSEKLENVVQIIKKRNPHLFQQEDEIEVDIDSVDLDTLWELNQFVANHKNSLSKVKNKDEASHLGSADAERELPRSNVDARANKKLKENERGSVETNVITSYPHQAEKQGANRSRSNSSGGGSGSSASGSSSSDSDSDGSSS